MLPHHPTSPTSSSGCEHGDAAAPATLLRSAGTVDSVPSGVLLQHGFLAPRGLGLAAPGCQQWAPLSPSAGEINFVPVGVLLQGGSIVSEGFRLVLIQILLQRQVGGLWLL